MHTKSELEGLPIENLTEIARNLGIKTTGNPEKLDLIYNIIDAESVQPSTPNTSETTERQPKKRGRKSKAEKEAEEQEAKARKAKEKVVATEPAPEPAPEQEKEYRCSFTVKATKSQLRKLKEFMNTEGIKYE